MPAARTNDLGRQVLAAIAVTITVADAGLAVWLIVRQHDVPAAWFLTALCVAALLGVYGVVRAAPWQTAALGLGGAILVVLGVLAILSVGMPLIIAGLLLWIAAVLGAGRHRRGQPASKPRQE